MYKFTVNRVYKFEEENTIYYSVKGNNNYLTFDDSMLDRWELCKPPLVIVSDLDPYGEEDWAEE